MVQNKESAEPPTKTIDGKVFTYHRPGVYVRCGVNAHFTDGAMAN